MEKMDIVKIICDSVATLLNIRLPVGELMPAMEISRCAKNLNDLAKTLIEEEKTAGMNKTEEKTTE